MSKREIHYTEYIKQGVFIIIVIAVALFGIKGCRNYQKKRQVIIELSSHASESAAYEQFYEDNARENLFKSMYQMHLGTELGLTPAEVMQKVMDEEEEFFSTEDKDDLPIRQSLIRDSLLSNYDNCIKLGIFDTPSNLQSLAEGEAPMINKGPASGESAVLEYIIPSSVLPGVDKLLPNLVISPPAMEDGAKIKTKKFDLFEIARAKKFAKSLSNASLIESDASSKIIDFYNQAAAAATPSEVKPEPAP